MHEIDTLLFPSYPKFQIVRPQIKSGLGALFSQKIDVKASKYGWNSLERITSMLDPIEFVEEDSRFIKLKVPDTNFCYLIFIGKSLPNFTFLP